MKRSRELAATGADVDEDRPRPHQFAVRPPKSEGLLTARATDADVWRGWQSGADYYLTKPFDLDELLAFIDQVVRR